MFDPQSLRRRGVEDLEAAVGRAGSPPFKRGISAGGYRELPWIIGQYGGFGSAAAANQRLRELLAQGQTGFSVALDLPTQMGLDSDDPRAEGEVGRIGVAIDSLADVEALFDGIPLEDVRQIRTTANAIGPTWLAMVVALCEKRGLDPASLRILIQNDVLKEYIARGTFIYPPAAAVGLVVDTIEWCVSELPTWTPLTLSGYHIRETGADAVQELAFTFANAIAYAEAAAERGIEFDSYGGKLFSFLSAGTDLLEEVAKFRAARAVWSELTADRLGATDPDARALRIFAFSAGSELTAQQPTNNIVRVAIAALAAVLGSAQTIHTAAFDEAYATPTAEAAKLALRTQLILRDEGSLAAVADPLGGSWAIESLTVDLERAVKRMLRKVDELGGAIACIESGWFAAELAEAAYQQQLALDDGRRTVIGLNSHTDADGYPEPEVFRIDPRTEEIQRRGVERIRRERDQGRVERALARLEAAAQAGENTVPATLEAVRAYATVGEICARLRAVWGTHSATANPVAFS